MDTAKKPASRNPSGNFGPEAGIGERPVSGNPLCTGFLQADQAVMADDASTYFLSESRAVQG